MKPSSRQYGGVKHATKTLKKKKAALVKPIKINFTKNLKKIAENMNKNTENPAEYLKKSKRFFKALKTVTDDALDKNNQELYDGLITTAGYISHNIYEVFKRHDKGLKNSINALTDLFGKVGLNKNSTYHHLLDEELATNQPLDYLDHLSEEINNMTKLYIKSIHDGNEEESTRVSILMAQISEEIKKSIQQAIAHDVPKNESGLADMMNRIFKKAFN
jgi:hypothetical protein